jgi:hypothetical protein
MERSFNLDGLSLFTSWSNTENIPIEILVNSVYKSIVKTAGASLPKLEVMRNHTIAPPMRRARHRFVRKLIREFGNCFFQFVARAHLGNMHHCTLRLLFGLLHKYAPGVRVYSRKNSYIPYHNARADCPLRLCSW